MNAMPYFMLLLVPLLPKVHKFQQNTTFRLASALLMLYDDSCQLGAGLSASRRAWERVSLHELL